MHFDHHSDEALMALARDAHPRGETWTVRAAFDELVLRHKDRIRAIALRRLPLDEAEDLAQDVFLALFDTVVDGKDVGRVSAWLNRVAANKTADFWRGPSGKHVHAHRAGVHLDDDDPDAPAHELPDAGHHERAEAQLVVEQLLDRRSRAHQAVIRLYVLEGRSAKDVADATGETADNVYQVAKRFRDDLRAALRGEDPSTEDRT